MATHRQVHDVDSKVWKACVGSFRVPAVGQTVYYFPQGHAEQLRSLPPFSPEVYNHPMILCRVDSVRYLADSETDELFAKIQLVPISDNSDDAEPEIEPACENDDNDNGETVESFRKILTPSDANNGGGFTIPRVCAQSILPELKINKTKPHDETQPFQYISFKDVLGNDRVLRHVYRGWPRRHLLTNGWSKFVDAKKLVPGDSIVFVKKKKNDIGTETYYIGIRRLRIKTTESGYFSRMELRMISPESVVEAVELAAAKKPFEVSYFPMVGRSEFIVNSKLVQKSCSFNWATGVRVKMAVDTKDSWCLGTVLSSSMVQAPADSDDPNPNNPWRVINSPWKMLLVEWDKSEDAENMNKRVSPWQVECHHYMPKTKASFAKVGSKRGRNSFPIETRSLNDNIVDVSSSTTIHAHNYGMQGVRQQGHNLDQIPPLPNFINEESGLQQSTDLALESSTSHSQSERNISPESQNNNNNPESTSTVNESLNNDNYFPFKLFGKIIHVKVEPPFFPPE